MVEPTMQSSLGSVQKISNKNERVASMGYLAFGKILKVHHKRYTADVQIFGTNDVITSSSDLEGRYACKIGVSNAGFDEKYKRAYGEVIPIQKNSIVLVGFLRNSKEKPVILRVFHSITEEVGEVNYENVLTSFYPVTDEVDMNRYLNVTRIQDFVTIGGDGNLEIASHTKSFFVGINNKEIDEENFDFEDLSVKDQKQQTINVGEGYSKPMKWLAVFRSNFANGLTDWLRVFVDASKSSFKLAKQQQSENKLSSFEIGQDGSIRVKRQQDTKSFEGSSDFSELTIQNDGTIEVKKQNGSTTTITITDDGVKLSTDASVEVSAKKAINLSVGGSTIDMSPSNIKINSPKVDIN